MADTFHAGPVELRCGRWQDVLRDVRQCDAVITDPPYSERTHSANADMSGQFSNSAGRVKPSDGRVRHAPACRRDVSYECLTPADARDFVARWCDACAGWFGVMCDDLLAPSWRAAYHDAALYDFAPVVIKQDRVRLVGDGPASAAVYFVVARPKTQEFSRWGALPGWYDAATERGAAVVGAKPLPLMRAIVRDYSRPGDLVVDPYAGGATTLLAAAIEGRRAVGAEADPATFEKACERLAKGWTPDLFAGAQ